MVLCCCTAGRFSSVRISQISLPASVSCFMFYWGIKDFHLVSDSSQIECACELLMNRCFCGGNKYSFLLYYLTDVTPPHSLLLLLDFGLFSWYSLIGRT